MVNGREINDELLRIKQVIRNTSLEDFDNAMKECGYKEEHMAPMEAFAVQNRIRMKMKNYTEHLQKNYREGRSKVITKDTKDNRFDLNYNRVGAA